MLRILHLPRTIVSSTYSTQHGELQYNSRQQNSEALQNPDMQICSNKIVTVLAGAKPGSLGYGTDLYQAI